MNEYSSILNEFEKEEFSIIDFTRVNTIFEVGLCEINNANNILGNFINSQDRFFYYRQVSSKTSAGYIANMINSNSTTFIIQPSLVEELDSKLSFEKLVTKQCWRCVTLNTQLNSHYTVNSNSDKLAKVMSNPFKNNPEEKYLCPECLSKIRNQITTYYANNHGDIFAKLL